ncbi:MAG: hypothetical protein NTW86_25635 [Candidatus Sumerlaeota bacterium]|nr:hypothetical protein [Candidatus Sumerlaeota bacterium]
MDQPTRQIRARGFGGVRLLNRLLQQPQTVFLASFALAILTGGVVLRLPVSQAEAPVAFLDALFTSTSAVCVTGLIVVDTATAYSRFGHCVIVLLIQLGGLGVMTFAAFGLHVFGRRMSMRSRAVVHDSFFHEDAAREFGHALVRVIGMVLTIEAIGVAALFVQRAAWAIRRWWSWRGACGGGCAGARRSRCAGV